MCLRLDLTGCAFHSLFVTSCLCKSSLAVSQKYIYLQQTHYYFKIFRWNTDQEMFCFITDSNNKSISSLSVISFLSECWYAFIWSTRWWQRERVNTLGKKTRLYFERYTRSLWKCIWQKPDLCLPAFLFNPFCIVLACSYCMRLDWLVVRFYLLALGMGADNTCRQGPNHPGYTFPKYYMTMGISTSYPKGHVHFLFHIPVSLFSPSHSMWYCFKFPEFPRTYKTGITWVVSLTYPISFPYSLPLCLHFRPLRFSGRRSASD